MTATFKAVEKIRPVSDAVYDKRVPGLRVDLVNAQFDLQQSRCPVLIVLAGDDRWGCNELIDRLHEWFDARYLKTEVILERTDEENRHPKFWRYWKALPRRGQIGIQLGSWPASIISSYVTRRIDADQFEQFTEHAVNYERALADDGALILKFWLHLSKKDHARRLKKAKNDPDEAWFIEQEDWKIYDLYDKAEPIVERYIQETDTPYAPWHVVNSTRPNQRDLHIGETILKAIRKHLSRPVRSSAPAAYKPIRKKPSMLNEVDLKARLDGDTYRKKLDRLQMRIAKLGRKMESRNRSLIVALEGWDAAGKGGVIRRLTAALPARLYRIIPTAAPTEEEHAYHYLWRFWKNLPRKGKMSIFDRSWYGRVLVERVEGFAREDEWRRAYKEINDFESQLAEGDMPVLKFFLHIDAAEQLRRFREREKTAFKKYKITREDYRNRAKWDAYVEATEEMLLRTGTDFAPWHVIAANDKKHARICVLETVCQTLEETL